MDMIVHINKNRLWCAINVSHIYIFEHLHIDTFEHFTHLHSKLFLMNVYINCLWVENSIEVIFVLLGESNGRRVCFYGTIDRTNEQKTRKASITRKK